MNNFFYLLAVLPLLYIPVTAFGGPYSGPCGFTTYFDNPVFNKTDTVPIKIWANCGEIGKNAKVTVTDGGSDDMKNKFFEQTVGIKQNPTEVDFKIPANTTVDRFMISILNEDEQINDRWMIFTNDAASRITISNVKTPPSIQEGDDIPIAANIVDGLGRSVPVVSASAEVQYPSCDGSFHWIDSPDFSHITVPMTRNSSEYTAVLHSGSNMISGTFPLKITLEKPHGYYPLYWNPVWIGKITVEPVASTNKNSTMQAVDTLFHHIYDSSFMGAIYTNRNHGPGDDIIVSGQTATDGCAKPIPNVNITGYFKGMPSPVIRAHTVSDGNGNFQIHFQTYPQLTMGRGYNIELHANYDGKDYSWSPPDEIILWDIKHFTFNVENKTSMANVLVDYGYQVDSLTLDKESKTLSFAGRATNNQGTFTISIPHDLIGGDLVVLKDGKQIAKMSSDQNSASGEKIYMFGTDAGYTVIQYMPGQAEKVNLQIMGTTVIPEFSLAGIIFVVSMSALVLSYGIKRNSTPLF